MICSIAIIVLLVTIPLSTASLLKTQTAPTQIKEIEKTIGKIDLDLSNPESVIQSLKDVDNVEVKITEQEEKTIWQNKNSRRIFEVASITGQLIEMEIKTSSPIIISTGDQTTTLSSSDFYLRWYKVTAKNAWGWSMFWLCARGFFIFYGPHVLVLPSSYADVDWWCGWAWSKDDLDQRPTTGDNW